MPVARLAATTAVTVRAETIVLLIGPDGRVLAPASALPPAPRRALSDAARALGGDDNHRLPGALIQRQGTVILTRTADPHDLESVRRAFGGAVRELTDKTLKQIAHELTERLRQNLSVDWSKRESVRAKLRLLVKRILRKYKYPPDMADSAVELVLQQAEALGENWSI